MEKQAFNDILAKVPGSFKAKLDKIRRYLYLGKASVMVGAGFSRNADVPAHVKVKMWNDVGEDIFCRLQASPKAEPSDLVFKTPMRLASQFAAVYGRSELDNLIRDSIPDDHMTPGTMHYQLLNLPWRDVFTTNYDTLLERSRKKLKRNYSVVTSKEMLLYKTSPRIVKLHGSFPDKPPFLMTEEDFRTYPITHPEFVNTVRQALVESIFCLIGFSGDDPNFTSWLAWLQDVMGEYAGPSYLITCDKNYDESFKTLMKQRGVEVINFSEYHGLGDFKTALDFFFTFLSIREPEWKGCIDYDDRDIKPKELIEQMRKVRESYPGWFILPKKYYCDFNDMQYNFPYLEEAFKTIEATDREALLYELDWRADISLTYKDYNWFRNNIEKTLQGYTEEHLSDNAITIGISLLRLYRHHLDKQDNAHTLQIRLEKEINRMNRYTLNKYYYTAACNALSLLNYDEVADILKIWNPTSSDYVGVIYKALIMAECSDRSESIEILSESLEKITLSLTQNPTQEELSLRSAMENLLAFYSGDRMPENDSRFSFLELSYFIRSKTEESHKNIGTVHSFRVGSFNRTWNMNSGINKDLFYSYRYLLLYEAYGFPYGMATNVVDEQILEYILPKLIGLDNICYALGPVLRSGSRNVTLAYLCRNMLTLLSQEQGDDLAKILLSHTNQIAFEKARKRRCSEVLLPFLSRLASLCSMETVVNIFRFALQAYLDSRTSRHEDLQLIYDNLLPEGIQSIYDEAFNSDIFSDVCTEDIPLPDDGMYLYKPNSKAIDIVCTGLASTDNPIAESAYRRATKLLEANLNNEDKLRLAEAIKKWRSNTTPSLFTRASYNEIVPSKDEINYLKQLVREDVNILIEGNYTYDKSSISISSLDRDLRNVVIEAQFLTTRQTTSVFEKISNVLNTNSLEYSKNDSNDVLGGLRHFIVPIFQLISELVRQVIDKGYVESVPSSKLFKVLQGFLSSHLPVRATMARLNVICRAEGSLKIRNTITAQLFSDNNIEVIDSCKGLVYYVSHYDSYQKVLQNIIFYCSHAVSDKMRIYLQTLSSIHVNMMSDNTKKQLASMMMAVLDRIPVQDISEEIKLDILHDGISLAASLDGITTPDVLVNAINKWKSYAINNIVFNDILRPWFVRND